MYLIPHGANGKKRMIVQELKNTYILKVKIYVGKQTTPILTTTNNPRTLRQL